MPWPRRLSRRPFSRCTREVRLRTIPRAISGPTARREEARTQAITPTYRSPGGRYEGVKVAVNVGLICHWTLMCSEENIHANDAGHAQIAKAFEKIVSPLLAADRHGGRDRPFQPSRLLTGVAAGGRGTSTSRRG